MPTLRSRSSSLSSLSSVESFNEKSLNAIIPDNAKILKKEKPDFEVVINSKLSPAASGCAEYESFLEEKEETNTEKSKEELKPEENKKDEDGEEIIPDHYYSGGKIPVFKPTMKQFESFKKFVDKINHYGMKSGIVKIIAPQEWLDTLPALDDKVKDIKIKNPIVQHINGNSGTYRQANVEKQRTYNLPEWRKLCEGTDHQPPARRGERRLGQAPKKAHRAVGTKRGSRAKNVEDPEPKATSSSKRSTSPALKEEEDEELEGLDEGTPAPKTDSHGRQPRKTATSPEAVTDAHGRQPRSRRRATRKSGKDDDYVDDSVWEGFDYRIQDADEYTPERCEELERAYWRTLTYNNPLYGADMPGSLFDDSTTSWNVAKLENLLDCLGQKLPGVNTAYLYLGMWKSTFAWHLEDVDLYSINYIHFGAPKQWYSISQEDAPKFEKVMKSIWPQEARKCDQFLRHKTFLVSPSLLQQNGITVNKLVHHQGEFVITFPYGYHSGYNLGYNCAESVNFATESWLDFGRIAKKCHCIDDAVWVDVREIERRLRGELTEDEYEGEEYEGFVEGEGGTAEFLTPPESVDVKPRRKRQRVSGDEKEPKKRIRKVNLKINVAAQRDHCILCPNDMPTEEMLPTDNGKKAHRLCATYTPETYFATDEATGKEIIRNVAGIPKSRLELRCMFCKVAKQGACFQCTAKKCIRGYHATCAAAAGVLVEIRDSWVADQVTGEYTVQRQIDFQCKYHRPKRDKHLDGEALEESKPTLEFGRSLIKGDVVQMQFFRQEIFAGVVVENRLGEGTVLVDVLPKGGLVEVEWKWILATDPVTSTVGPEPHSTAANAISTNGKQSKFPKTEPDADDLFCEGNPGFKWAEFISQPLEKNPYQQPVDLKNNFWYYLGEQSTEAIPKYSSDPAHRVHCPESVTWMVQKPARPAKSASRVKAVVVPPPQNVYPHPYYHTYQANPHTSTQQPPPPPPPPPQAQWPPYQQYYPYYQGYPQHPHQPHHPTVQVPHPPPPPHQQPPHPQQPPQTIRPQQLSHPLPPPPQPHQQFQWHQHQIPSSQRQFAPGGHPRAPPQPQPHPPQYQVLPQASLPMAPIYYTDPSQQPHQLPPQPLLNQNPPLKQSTSDNTLRLPPHSILEQPRAPPPPATTMTSTIDTRIIPQKPVDVVGGGSQSTIVTTPRPTQTPPTSIPAPTAPAAVAPATTVGAVTTAVSPAVIRMPAPAQKQPLTTTVGSS